MKQKVTQVFEKYYLKRYTTSFTKMVGTTKILLSKRYRITFHSYTIVNMHYTRTQIDKFIHSFLSNLATTLLLASTGQALLTNESSTLTDSIISLRNYPAKKILLRVNNKQKLNYEKRKLILFLF